MPRLATRAACAVAAAVGFATVACGAETRSPAASSKSNAVLFENVRIFDGRSDHLSGPAHVLVVGNTIRRISTTPLSGEAGADVRVIAGEGRTLMPGLIDAHVHVMFATLPQTTLVTADLAFVTTAAVKTAGDMLRRGFTSVRDLGGPVFGLKRGIDAGFVAGPRIWPSGAFISQSGGHGDFRFPFEMPARPGEPAYAERIGATAIADGPDLVRQRAREQLALGASQVKVMAGGGVSSAYDPLDVTQYTVAELRAAVEAAENWGTYVTVHAYTPRSVRQAVEAGVKCIDHGHLLDDATARLMAERGVWWSLQPFTGARTGRFPEGSPNRQKEQAVATGTETAYALARKYKVRTAFGTDLLFDPEATTRQTARFLELRRWYTPAEMLRMATADNAQLLALSGPRNPYPGTLGVVEEGALADLLLVDGDPLADIGLLGDPERTLLVVMKDGRIYTDRTG